MPWTRKEVKYLLSKVSPLEPDQQQSMKDELHADPKLGHARKGSPELRKKKTPLAPLK